MAPLDNLKQRLLLCIIYGRETENIHQVRYQGCDVMRRGDASSHAALWDCWNKMVEEKREKKIEMREIQKQSISKN